MPLRMKNKLRSFFSFPRIDLGKPPLKPKWAVILSLIVLICGLLLVAIANLYLDIPLLTALLWFAVVAYLSLGLSWTLLVLPILENAKCRDTWEQRLCYLCCMPFRRTYNCHRRL